jgi:hypothetical protein
MAHKRKMKRVSRKKWLENKVARARKASSRRYWLFRYTSYCMAEGRRQSRKSGSGRAPKWSFNRKRY